MARTAAENRLEVYVDEKEDFLPSKSNRHQRRTTRHKNKEKFKTLLKSRNTDELRDLDFDDFYEE
jgi:hypothetical protein